MVQDASTPKPVPHAECEKIVREQVHTLLSDMRAISKCHFDPDISVDSESKMQDEKALEDTLTQKYLIMLNRRGLIDLGIAEEEKQPEQLASGAQQKRGQSYF